MSDYPADAVVANESCSCGAHIEVASATGWMDSSNVLQHLNAWRRDHQHPWTETWEEEEE